MNTTSNVAVHLEEFKEKVPDYMSAQNLPTELQQLGSTCEILQNIMILFETYHSMVLF